VKALKALGDEKEEIKNVCNVNVVGYNRR